ncbi:MAG: cellulase family glycosylhydrolase [Myxococcota bacterium]
MRVRLEGHRFVDAAGRTVLLRGVNLAGSSKVPKTPDGATWRRERFFDHRAVSFVGRPFPLQEADAHLERLASWGLTTLRLLVTWEAVEHEGPGRYDGAYLDFLEAVVRRAGERGFVVILDFHQDVWSRFSGGDGAPGWTLEAVGFRLEHLHETGAAFVHSQHDGPMPRMIWPSNAGKLACATMFTLFFGGDLFAPRRRVEGEGAQGYLQRHFLGAVEQVARRLAGLDCVLGYDVLNEPSPGFIGWDDLTRPHGPVTVGVLPSPLEGMALGDGLSLEVDVWKRDLFGPRVVGRASTNPRRLRAWREDAACPWREEGVWDVDSAGKPRLLRPDAFTRVGGRRVDFGRDCYLPFFREAARRLHAISPDVVVFAENEPFRAPPPVGDVMSGPVAYAPHWYDGVVLFLKRFHSWLGVDAFTERPVFFPGRIRASYRAQLERLGAEARAVMGERALLLGEFGVPFDLHGGEALVTGDFREVSRALERSLRAVEDAGVHATLWSYTPDNTHAHGDGWNGEDLSVFCAEDGGGRALDALVRPYPRAVPGTVVRYGFDSSTRVFELVFRHDGTDAPAEAFLPARQYPHGVEVRVSDGRVDVDLAAQRLMWWHDARSVEHALRVMPRAR